MAFMRNMGEDWIAEQRLLPPDDRHAVARWVNEVQVQRRTAKKRSDGSFVPNGQVTAALTFAFDLYCLQIVEKLPDSLVRRLRNRDGFQGAWYEVFIAGLFARSDFDVKWLDDAVPNKHGE